MWREMSYNQYQNINNFSYRLMTEPEENEIDDKTWCEWIYEDFIIK